jgi:hypothetical protein
VVVPVVVEVEDAVELAVLVHVNVLRVLHALAHRLPRILLHLDVVELPATEHSFYSFGGFDSRRVGGGGVIYPRLWLEKKKTSRLAVGYYACVIRG